MPPLWGLTGALGLQTDTALGLPSRSSRNSALTSDTSNCKRRAISGLQTHCNTEGINPTGFIWPHQALHYKCLCGCIVLQSKASVTTLLGQLPGHSRQILAVTQRGFFSQYLTVRVQYTLSENSTFCAKLVNTQIQVCALWSSV